MLQRSPDLLLCCSPMFVWYRPLQLKHQHDFNSFFSENENWNAKIIIHRNHIEIVVYVGIIMIWFFWRNLSLTLTMRLKLRKLSWTGINSWGIIWIVLEGSDWQQWMKMLKVGWCWKAMMSMSSSTGVRTTWLRRQSFFRGTLQTKDSERDFNHYVL